MFPESARNFFLSLSFALAAWTTPATWRVLFAAAGCNIRSGANQGHMSRTWRPWRVSDILKPSARGPTGVGRSRDMTRGQEGGQEKGTP